MKVPKTIIIKRVRRRHEERHGGQWKVAYADFVTALMAFFLLMWLVAMVAPDRRAMLANYFRDFAVFQQTGSSLMDGSLDMSAAGEAEARRIMQESIGQGSLDFLGREQLRERLKREIEIKLADVSDQVMVDIFEGGVRIQIVDHEGRPMFAVGSSEPTEDAIRILKVIADNIKGLRHDIAIEGHTDASTYSTGRYTNWELSTERASAARKRLEAGGMNPDNLTRVAGYAATVPLLPEDPTNPRNRRVSIILLYPSEEGASNKVNLNELK